MNKKNNWAPLKRTPYQRKDRSLDAPNREVLDFKWGKHIEEYERKEKSEVQRKEQRLQERYTRDKIIFTLRAKGKTYREIAKVIGVTKQRVQQIVRKNESPN